MRKLINCVLLLSAMTVFTSCFIDDLLDGLKDETVINSDESAFESMPEFDKEKFGELFHYGRGYYILESILKESILDNIPDILNTDDYGRIHYAHNHNIAVVINSESDMDFDYLENNYKEHFLNYDVRSLWPQIDYTKNSLVIGQIILPDTAQEIKGLVLKKSKDGYRFEATYGIDNRFWGGLCTPTASHFWCIYPKLDTDRIEDIRCTKIDLPDTDK